MNIDYSGNLIFYTYYMVDWEKVKQFPSSATCVSCGRKMSVVEPVKDKKGKEYEGRVCHNCKKVYWVRR